MAIDKFYFPLAQEFAAIIDKSEDFQNSAAEAFFAKRALKRGPVNAMFELRTILGDRIDELPMFGTRDDDKLPDGSPRWNNPEIKVVQKKQTNGTYKPRDVSFYDELLSQMSAVRIIDTRLEAISKKDKAPQENCGIPDVDAMNPRQRIQEKNNLTSQKSARKATMLKAVKLHQRLEEVNSMDNMCAGIIEEGTDEKGKVVYSTHAKCIEVYSQLKPRDDFEIMDVDGFIKLDVARAMAGFGDYAPGSWEALKNSGKGKGETETPENKPMPKTFEDLEQNLTGLANFFDQENAVKAVQGMISRAKDPEKRKDFIRTWHALQNTMIATFVPFLAEAEAIEREDNAKNIAAAKAKQEAEKAKQAA